MRFSAKVLLLVGNAALGVMLLAARPREAAGEQQGPRTGCCKHDTAGNGVCCADCCTAVNGCTSSAACPKQVKT